MQPFSRLLKHLVLIEKERSAASGRIHTRDRAFNSIAELLEYFDHAIALRDAARARLVRSESVSFEITRTSRPIAAPIARETR